MPWTDCNWKNSDMKRLIEKVHKELGYDDKDWYDEEKEEE